MEILDERDQKIIAFLAKDSRVSLRKIAKELVTSTDTIMRRYQRLEKNHVIQPTITINLNKLGYEAYVYFAIKVASQNILRQITKLVLQIPDIVAVMETTGENDLMAIAVVRNIKHTFKIGEDISNVKGIRRLSIAQFDLISSKDSVYPPPIWNNLDLSP